MTLIRVKNFFDISFLLSYKLSGFSYPDGTVSTRLTTSLKRQ
jgi:hypothetical protein